MIYTVTFNPAIDYVVKTGSLKPGSVNRTEKEQIFFGGKGINVSIILKELGIDSKALGFVAGFTGSAIEEGIKSQGISTDFVHLDSGFSRINVKIRSDEETELNGQGPVINEQSINELFKKLNALESGDILVLAGSIPNTLPDDIYKKIICHLDGKGIRFVVDATKSLLLNVLKYKPFLIKPNNFELEDIFNVKLNSTDDIITYAKKLKELGACNVLVSRAENGAILIDDEDNIHIIGAPQGQVLNSVGAGDSMLAGFIAGFTSKNSYEYSLKLGTAAGSATAFSEGLADKKLISEILETL